VIERNSREIFEGTGHQEIVLIHPADARVRMETWNNGIADHMANLTSGFSGSH
jgi:hypothetical protein